MQVRYTRRSSCWTVDLLGA